MDHRRFSERDHPPGSGPCPKGLPSRRLHLARGGSRQRFYRGSRRGIRARRPCRHADSPLYRADGSRIGIGMAKDIILAADLGGVPITPDELAAIPDFSGIRKEIWGKFPGAIAKKTFQTGEILMREGESGTTAIYILSGSVEVFINNPLASVQSRKRPSVGLFRRVIKITDYVKGVPDPSERG